MKVTQKRLEKNLSGSIKILCEEPEDIWHLYNLISTGDIITGSTYRKVTKETNTGSTTSTKKKITVSLRIQTIDYDVKVNEIRLKGVNVKENDFIKLGQSHTLLVELHRAVTLYKECWDSLYLDRINDACNPANRAEIAVVLMQSGIANILVLTEHMTVNMARVEVNIPRKKLGSSTKHDKGLKKYYFDVYETMKRVLKFDVLKCVILASPGFLKEEFLAFMMTEATKVGDKQISGERDKFLLIDTSSGHKQSVKEILSHPQTLQRLEDTKYAGDVRVMNTFFELLNECPDKAFYGLSHVRMAVEANAVESLLVSDELFRSVDLETRKNYVKLVETVKENNGKVFIFSAMHSSGEQLTKMSGIAAILRYPMPEIEEAFDVSSSEEDE